MPSSVSAYHIFIPWVVAYGYAWSRNGREFIADGTFINIRAFAKPYADYTGPYHDNPYRIAVTQKPFPRPEPAVEPPKVEPPRVEPPRVEPPDTSMYMPETLKAFESIASSAAARFPILPAEAEPSCPSFAADSSMASDGDELDNGHLPGHHRFHVG